MLRSGGRAGSDHDVQRNVLSPNWHRLRQALKQTVTDEGAGRQAAAAMNAARLKMVLNFAEIADSEDIQNRQFFCIFVVDLVLGVSGDEQ